MASADVAAPAIRPPQALFVLTIFASATLVFLVQPMVAKLVLPLLGGSPSVWNTSMAFFQIALLAGYAYAHVLQRITVLRTQVLVHAGLLALAAIALPLRISEALGAPSSVHPNLWLVGVLALSIGAPFAILSATAPLVQAWHARTLGAAGREPYALYAASNLGSLLALLAYPILVEPNLTVPGQTVGWSVGYGLFVLTMLGLGWSVVRARAPALITPASTTPASTTPASTTPVADVAAAPPTAWRTRLIWIGLAAIPSSLMLGVTTHITTDVASAPFLWVIPLALYLATFVIAFQDKPLIPVDITLFLQGSILAICVAMLPFRSIALPPQLIVHLATFFLTALLCHQRLVFMRPPPARLTEFYLCLSIGGVVGGGFNAFVAPVIFSNVWEYPLVLALSCLARPWGGRKISVFAWVMLGLGILAATAIPLMTAFLTPRLTGANLVGDFDQAEAFELFIRVLLTTAMICAFMLRDRALLLLAVISVLSVAAEAAADRTDTSQNWRSFFGVLRESRTTVPSLGGEVRMLAHGTTLHGAQAQNPAYRCRPLVYYTPDSPIGQAFLRVQVAKPVTRIGAVGLGTGSVAAYVRPDDHLTFFEIDPLVIDLATDPNHFTYVTECAKGKVGFVVGDARLTLNQQPAGTFDILLIDAFSSDAVPAHLLTVEAVAGYMERLTPDGVLILHLSNRNLDLKGPAQAVAARLGVPALLQEYRPTRGDGWESAQDALLLTRSPQALAAFAADPRWKPADPKGVRPWTDDYTNLPGAMWRRQQERYDWLPG